MKIENIYISNNGIKFNSKEKCELYEKALKVNFDLLIRESFVFFDENFNPIEPNGYYNKTYNYAIKIKEIPCEFYEMYVIINSWEVQHQLPYSSKDDGTDTLLNAKKGTILQKVHKYDNSYWTYIPDEEVVLKKRNKYDNILKLYEKSRELIESEVNNND